MNRRALAGAMLGMASVAAAGCAGGEVRPYAGTAPATEILYVIAGGWHTEIGLAVRSIAGPLRGLEQVKSGATVAVFGWGQRDYYMAADPGLGDLLKATVPGPAVMLIIPLRTAPQDVFGPSHVFAVPVSPEGAARLSEYLWSELAKEPAGIPRPIAAGPYVGSAFYPSTSTYDVLTNCNTWTAEGLHVAGLPVSADGVLFADQVVDQVRSLAQAPRE